MSQIKKILYDGLSSERIGEILICYKEFLSDNSPVIIDDFYLWGVSDEDDFDNKTPIQFSSSKNKIALLENNVYEIYFKSDKIMNYDGIKSLSYFDAFSKSNLPSDNIFGGTLSFKNYSGDNFIDVFQDDKEIISIPITVIPKKLDHEKQYQMMIRDIFEVIYGFNSPVFKNFQLSDFSSEKIYELFIFLEYLFLDENLPSVFEYLDKNLHTILNYDLEEIPISKVQKISAFELIDSLNIPNNLVKLNEDSMYYNYFNGYFPKKANISSHKDTLNTNENKFYKYFLELVESLINDLLEFIYLNKSENSRKYDFISIKLNKFSDKITYFLSKNYFNEISKMGMLPLNSQVLQKKEGYRELLKYYLMLQFNMNISFDIEIEDIFKGYLKKINELYELWCYLKLSEVLMDLSCDHEEVDLFYNESGIIKINKHHTFKILNSNRLISITLSYQHEFIRNLKRINEEGEKIINKRYDPDFTLTLNEEGYNIIFDAKYKLNDDNGNLRYKSEDIDKMHTYNDAIKNSIGAFVLYPGDEKAFVLNDEGGYEVGAIPLRPDNDGDKRFLSNFIIKLLDETCF